MLRRVPPQKMVVIDESGSPLTSVVGPFPEGASFTLRCDVFGARPLPQVTWYRNNFLVSGESIVMASSKTASQVRSEIRVNNLTRKDVHSELTCRAKNNNRTAPLEATIHVDMNFGPLNVHILGSHQPLSAGRRYDLLCQSSGSRPPATVTWWKDDQRLENTKETTSTDGNTTTSTLSFTPKKEDDGKNLSCRAENKVLSFDNLKDEWKLEIHYNPETKIILGTSLVPDDIREGTDVYFDCYIVAHPPVYKVDWRHNGRILNINVTAGIIITNQSLVLQGVSRTTAGNYTCVGHNTEGDGESEPFFLNVLYSPTCRPNQPKIYGVAKQERAQIKCQVDANPSDVHFRWTFNNSADSSDVAQTHITRTGTSSIVSYTPMTELDYGTLLCYASNTIGSQRVACVFHIIAAGRPDQPHNCTIFNISMTSFSVRCSEGFNGGLPQFFLLEVRESQSQEMKHNMTSPVARFSVANLEAGVQYQTAIYSCNSKGRGEPVILQTSTLRLPEKQLTSEKDLQTSGFRVTPLMSILIGIVLAIFIIAMIVLMVLKLQCAQNDDIGQKNRQKVASSGALAGIDRHNSGSIIALSDKGGGSPSSKHDSSAGECDSDEKNPDIIPQPVDGDDSSEYSRKRQHISTIETSPSRSILHQPNNSAFMGYCTLRNGMPLHEIAAQSKMMQGPSQLMGPYSSCTIPRQPHPQWQYGPISHLPPGMYPVAYRGPYPQTRPRLQPREPPIALQSLASNEEEPSVETPLMGNNKRESTV